MAFLLLLDKLGEGDARALGEVVATAQVSTVSAWTALGSVVVVNVAYVCDSLVTKRFN